VFFSQKKSPNQRENLFPSAKVVIIVSTFLAELHKSLIPVLRVEFCCDFCYRKIEKSDFYLKVYEEE
tara:strand:+ start:16697 stop:16897 length:201 start_codon:yes stop_codon:yes gene_type:complete